MVTDTSSFVPRFEEDSGAIIALTPKSLSALTSDQNETHGLACLMAN